MNWSRVILASILCVILAGCGGDEDPVAPNNEQIAEISPAVTGIGLDCLQRGGPDDNRLTEYVDALERVYKDTDPDAKFKMTPNAPDVTMKSLVSRAQETLSLCADTGQSSAAAGLADRLGQVLDG